MWQLGKIKPVKLIIGILAADQQCLNRSHQVLTSAFGKFDFVSDIWPFDKTDYYKDQAGEHILRQFVSIEKLIDPDKLAKIKHKTNALEQKLARKMAMDLCRPVNLDPGIIEPSKLILATTKNYSHRIYIGRKMYAEVTLVYDKGLWQPLPYTYPDYRSPQYFEFFSKVRGRLLDQLRATAREQ